MSVVRAPWSQPFWEGVDKRELRYQRCNACETTFFPPQKYCAACSSEDLGWHVSSGRGTVYACSTVFKGAPEAYNGRMPYTVAIVELEEGFRMSTQLVDGEPDSWACDQPVTAEFRALPELRLFPVFVAGDHPVGDQPG
ncbi:Zn-ribbon domain-containing OB-fold protein [Alloalcanivorax gelatiniphagus]